MTKTNAMRILDALKISYITKQYDVDPEDLSGVHAAELMGLDPNGVFETDRLTCSYDFIAIYTFCKADIFTFFNRGNTVFLQNTVDFLDSSFITFK